MKKIICTLAFTMTALSASATVETGNSFLDHMVRPSLSKNMIDQYLIGYVAGMADAHENEFKECLGPNVKMSQLVDAVKIFLENNPQIRHAAMKDLYPMAIKKIFNCK